VDKFSGMVAIPHGFNHGNSRSILAFVKTSEQQKEAMQAGASMAGGADIIRDIQVQFSVFGVLLILLKI
jgi:large subunit ribosomal protein L1